MEADDRNAGAYRRLTSRASEKLNPLDQDTVLNMMRYLYYANPICRRLVEIPADFSYNNTVKCKSEKVQEIVDKFWNHPYNNMPLFSGQLIEQFHLDGELLLPVEVNPQDGFVKLTYQDATRIKKIEAFEDDNRYIETIHLKSEDLKESKKYQIVRYRDDTSAKINIGEANTGNSKEVSATGFRVGEAFYFRQCHLIMGRGRPPLEPVADWLDAHDYTFYDQLRNIALQSAFVWDITLKGASPTQVSKRRAEIKAEGPPKPGSLRVHNDSEEWKAEAPQLQARIATDLLVQVRKVVGLGSGKSETWMAASEDVNRNTAQVADTPPQRHLERQQFQQSLMFSEIIEFVIDMAILHGTLSIASEDERKFTIELPDLTTADNLATAQALEAATTAVEKGLNLGIINNKTGITLFYKISGLDEPETLEEDVARERDERDKRAFDKQRQAAELVSKQQEGKPNEGPSSKSGMQ